jgi:hypothetical protein
MKKAIIIKAVTAYLSHWMAGECVAFTVKQTSAHMSPSTLCLCTNYLTGETSFSSWYRYNFRASEWIGNVII